MSSNPSKCNVMHVTKKKTRPILHTYMLKGEPLAVVDTATHLGVSTLLTLRLLRKESLRKWTFYMFRLRFKGQMSYVFVGLSTTRKCTPLVGLLSLATMATICISADGYCDCKSSHCAKHYSLDENVLKVVYESLTNVWCHFVARGLYYNTNSNSFL